MPPDSCTLFDHNERGYFRWLGKYPHGYVLNTARGPSPRWMVLHRAACPTIKTYRGAARPGGFTERETVKVCAAEIDALEAWLKTREAEAVLLRECGFCKPRQLHIWEATSMYTLHEAIRKVLAAAGGPLSTPQIAAEINRRSLYLRRDHAPLRAGQVSARVRRHPELFARREKLVELRE